MEIFFNRLHDRRESLKREEQSKRNQWRDDERWVRSASCDFTVKYLGFLEVSESKGIQVIQNVIKTLKYGELEPSSQFSLFKNKSKSSESLYHFGTLQVSGEGLRFLDDSTEDVLVDTPIAKISFCGPVENGKFFGYICREETHWKWICHVFKAAEDHADRINNAVGCAFHMCVEARHKARMENLSVPSTSATPTATNYTQASSGKLEAAETDGTSTYPAMAALPSMNLQISSSSQVAQDQQQQPQLLQSHVDHFDLAWELKGAKIGST